MKVFLILFLTAYVYGQELVSPCPKIFQYEPRIPDEPDRWYGYITLLPESEFVEVFLRVILDKPALEFGNWFGEVTSKDNKDHLVKSRNFVLRANTLHNLRFYVKFNTSEPPPMVSKLQFNGQMVCPEPMLPIAFTMGKLFKTQKKPDVSTKTNQSSAVVPDSSSTSNTIRRNPFEPYGEDDDFFHGDFSILFIKQNTVSNNENEVMEDKPKPDVIFPGQRVDGADYPWHAAIFYVKDTDLTYVCGGTLISPHHVITAAHCVMKQMGNGTVDNSKLRVYLGKHYLKSWSSPGIQHRPVEKIFFHEKYEKETLRYDIALLKLSKPVETTVWVKPAVLWNKITDLSAMVGKTGVVAGWGFNEIGKVSDELQNTYMQIVSNDSCVESYPDYFAQLFISERTYCAEFKNDNVCNGDSGSGMVFLEKKSRTSKPEWILRGMVRWSVALTNEYKCEPNHYVVFTDVAQFLDWIDEKLVL